MKKLINQSKKVTEVMGSKKCKLAFISLVALLIFPGLPAFAGFTPQIVRLEVDIANRSDYKKNGMHAPSYTCMVSTDILEIPVDNYRQRSYFFGPKNIKLVTCNAHLIDIKTADASCNSYVSKHGTRMLGNDGNEGKFVVKAIASFDKKLKTIYVANCRYSFEKKRLVLK